MVDEIQQNRQFAMAEVRPLIGAHEARVNVTWQGQNADLPDPVAWDAQDTDVKRMVTEALQAGIPGIRPDAQANLQDFVVDRFAANDAVPYNRFMIRPKTPFGSGDGSPAPTETPPTPPGQFRLRYDEGESGWAQDLKDGTAEILNLPLAEGLNISDIVKIELDTGMRRRAGEVVKRTYPKKTGVTYPEPHQENYEKLYDAANKAGWPIESMVPGTAMVAHPADTNFADLAAKAGVTVETSDLL